jgi:DNA-binding SARP family transcriptional activator
MHTVLAALLLSEGNLISDERLSALLWGWDPPATAAAQIYTYISRLRKCLLPAADIERRSPGYVLRIGSGQLDYREFLSLFERGREELAGQRHEQAAATLRAALGLWRGTALSTVTEFMASEEQPRLQEIKMVAVEGRVEADLAIGRHSELVPELVHLVGEYPLREMLRAHLMVALYLSGRQADAIATFHAGRRILADELGIDPGPGLRHAYQEIIEGTVQVAAAPAPQPLPEVHGVMRSMAGRAMLAEEVLESLIAARLLRATRRWPDGRVRYQLHDRAARAFARVPSMG